MRIFKLSGIIIMLMLLVSCSDSGNNTCESSPELYYQDINQLYITPDSEKNRSERGLIYNKHLRRLLHENIQY